MPHHYRLIGSITCPWVQRVAIVLRAKHLPYDVEYLDLRRKPDWFRAIAPYGLVPVLEIADGRFLFESAAIAEYLEEAETPSLHPADPFARARHRGWIEGVDELHAALREIYFAEYRADSGAARTDALPLVRALERALGHERLDDGPWFAGSRFSMVDAAYAPSLQRFAFADSRMHTGLLDEFPLTRAWIDTLLASEIVTGALHPDFEAEFVRLLRRRDSWVWDRFRDLDPGG